MAAFLHLIVWLTWAFIILAAGKDTSPLIHDYARRTNDRSITQDIVTWDQYSIKVHGERVVFLSGEVHPFRLPSPDLWFDVFQKIRALGFTGVSFYVMWGLLEGEPGTIRTDGVFALEQFFEAANKAGIYLLARPGPYINAEVSGGGFPGWVQRSSGALRTSEPGFLNQISTYLLAVGEIISKAQITKGGPVILVQPENEYTYCSNFTSAEDVSACLDDDYMASVQSQLRHSGVDVPFINNDAFMVGNYAPGTGAGAVDIYGFDDYPFEWSSGCSNPTNWTRGRFPLQHFNYTKQRSISSRAPFAILEFQGGATDRWGGYGVEACAAMVNHEFARVFYKLLYGMRVTVLNFYMIFGGTNWGNLGYHNGYTSYDVGAAIKENRQVDREKYSELKLQANFLRSSPSYATTHPLEGSFGFYTDTADVVVTPLLGQPTNFYIVRHADYRSLHSVEYKLLANTSAGSFQIPQLGNSLSLHGRDSKIHVTDYQAGDFTLVYSTSEIFSWAKTNTKTVLIMYGGLAETHEFSVSRSLGCPKRIEGGEVDCKIIKSLIVIQFNIQKSRKVIYFSPGLEIYLVWRNEAYNYWTLDLPKEHSDNVPFAPLRTNDTNATVIVKAGYLLRNASMEGTTLELFGDINRTTEIEIIAAPVMPTKLFFNGKKVCITRENQSPTRGTVVYHEPEIPLPDLSRLEWRFVNSLPEIQRDYDDKDWTPCTLQVTNNTRNLTTPTSLYAGDYGYHSGSVLYRGHFLAAESASHVSLHLQGGSGFGHSVWLNSSYLGSWAGHGSIGSSDQTLAFPQKLEKGKPYVLTILMDQMGLRDNWEVDLDGMRQPRGILDYSIPGLSDKSRIFWKVMGNFGGERYVDHSRGPLNEGSLFAERQGYHLPGAPTQDWPKRSPLEGLGEPDVGFFSTSFTLDMPKGYDVPISLVLGGIDHAFFRVQIFINGWQFGKYINNLGPQHRFVLPEGILDHNGENYLALTLWCQDESGCKLDVLRLEVDAILQSSYPKPHFVQGNGYMERNAF